MKRWKHLGKDLQNVAVIIANSYDESTLAAMAKRAKVIINVVGPVSVLYRLTLLFVQILK